VLGIWGLQVEADGIIGEGMNFKEKEKAIARARADDMDASAPEKECNAVTALNLDEV
jgi:hypothetical protein